MRLWGGVLYGLFALTACGEAPPPAQAPLPAPAPAPQRPALSSETVAALSSLSFAAPALEEQLLELSPPEEELDRSTPQALLTCLRGALVRGDALTLAWLCARPDQETALSEDALWAARRRFLGPATRRYWERCRAALATGDFEVEERGEEAWVSLWVGGAAGLYRLRLEREEGTWAISG